MLTKKESCKALEQHDIYKVQKYIKYDILFIDTILVIYALLNSETFCLYLYKKYKIMHVRKVTKQNSGFL